jgi:outer membrane protein
MKNINTILNIVLFIALGVLYFLHFSSGKQDQESVKNEPAAVKDFSTSLPIAYVNIDSLLAQMKMYTDLQEELSKKQQSLEANFASKYRVFEQSVSQFQNEVSKGLLTRSEMQTKDQQLASERTKLESLQSEYLNQMQEEGMVGQRKVINYIMEYLKEYNQEKGLQYIFSFSFGSNLLYAHDNLDITSEVLVGLNNKYNAETAEKK